jgi:hypothetical protein
MWKRTRPSEVDLIARGLALALHVNLPERQCSFQSVWVVNPSEELTASQAQKFREVLESASAKSQIALIANG